MNIIENDPNNVFKPNIKKLLTEREELNIKRSQSKNPFERMKLSSQIAVLDKKIVNSDIFIK